MTALGDPAELRPLSETSENPHEIPAQEGVGALDGGRRSAPPAPRAEEQADTSSCVILLLYLIRLGLAGSPEAPRNTVLCTGGRVQGCSTGIFRRHPVAVTRGVVGGRSPRVGSLVSSSQYRRFSKAAEVR